MKKLFLILLIGMTLAGCATTASYMSYTNQRLPPKLKDYVVQVYTTFQHLPSTASYRVIGRVEVQGYASDGVNPLMLSKQAQSIAKKKGADAIINADTQIKPYGGTYVVPGHFGFYDYHPTQYIPYGATFLFFTGELIVFTTALEDTKKP